MPPKEVALALVQSVSVICFITFAATTVPSFPAAFVPAAEVLAIAHKLPFARGTEVAVATWSGGAAAISAAIAMLADRLHRVANATSAPSVAFLLGLVESAVRAFGFQLIACLAVLGVTHDGIVAVAEYWSYAPFVLIPMEVIVVCMFIRMGMPIPFFSGSRG